MFPTGTTLGWVPLSFLGYAFNVGGNHDDDRDNFNDNQNNDGWNKDGYAWISWNCTLLLKSCESLFRQIYIHKLFVLVAMFGVSFCRKFLKNVQKNHLVKFDANYGQQCVAVSWYALVLGGISSSSDLVKIMNMGINYILFCHNQ